jgi:curved DNA-binding protein CbpA
MKSIPFQALDKARKILELPETADLGLIKSHYRRLCQKWHPDRNPERREEAEAMIKTINEAYELIMVLVRNYHYSFRKKDIQLWADPEGWWNDKFHQKEWIGGG